MPDQSIATILRKKQIERGRWYILLFLDAARPVGLEETLLLANLDETHYRFTPTELRRELDYLQERQLLKIEEKDGVWEARLTRLGIDLVEYTVECDPGIDRPPRS